MPGVAHRGRGRRAVNDINMVPFIDVMLVLLIIFMVTAPMIAPSVIDLPTVGKANKAPDKVVQIQVAKDETLQLQTDGQSRPVALPGLVEAVRAAQAGAADAAVVISADRTVRYEVVVKVMDTLQRAGVARVGLSMQLVP